MVPTLLDFGVALPVLNYFLDLGQSQGEFTQAEVRPSSCCQCMSLYGLRTTRVCPWVLTWHCHTRLYVRLPMQLLMRFRVQNAPCPTPNGCFDGKHRVDRKENYSISYYTWPKNRPPVLSQLTTPVWWTNFEMERFPSITDEEIRHLSRKQSQKAPRSRRVQFWSRTVMSFTTREGHYHMFFIWGRSARQ